MFLALYPGSERTYRPDINAARNRLTDIALDLGVGTKSALRPEVEETILAANAPMLRALADDHGVTFDAVDYARLDGLTIHDALDAPTGFAELCHVDPEVENLIAAKALQLTLGQPPNGAREHKPDPVADLRVLQRRLGQF